MNLKPELLRGVYAYGFERPSAIQQRAIMPVIKGEYACHKHIVEKVLTKNAQRIRCYRSSAVRYRQDRYLLYLRSAEDRPQPEGLPGSDSCSHS